MEDPRRKHQAVEPPNGGFVHSAPPQLVAPREVGIGLAGQFPWSPPKTLDRGRTETAFAKLGGVAPQPAAAGVTASPWRGPSGQQRRAHRQDRPNAITKQAASATLEYEATSTAKLTSFRTSSTLLGPGPPLHAKNRAASTPRGPHGSTNATTAVPFRHLGKTLDRPI